MPSQNKQRITAQLIKELKKQTHKSRVEIFDTELKGFHIRCFPSGHMSYALRYRPKGAHVQKRITIASCGDLKVIEARELCEELRGELAKGNDPTKARKRGHTLDSFLRGVYEPWAEDGLKTGPAICAAIRSAFKPLLKKPLAEINPLMIEGWRKKKHKGGTKPASTNRYITYLSSMLTRAATWDYIDSNPLKGNWKKSREGDSNPRYLEPAEMERLMQALEKREADRRAERARFNQWRRDRGLLPFPEHGAYTDFFMPLILSALNLGMRRGELFSLEWADVDLSTRSVYVKPAKTHKSRHVPMNDFIHTVLARWKEQGTGEGLVFPSPKTGQKLDNIKTAWKNLMKSAEIETFRLHDCRHDFASKLIQRGADLYTVQSLLGHTSYEMVQKYAHLAPQQKIDAVALLTQPNNVVSLAAAQNGK